MCHPYLQGCFGLAIGSSKVVGTLLCSTYAQVQRGHVRGEVGAGEGCQLLLRPTAKFLQCRPQLRSRRAALTQPLAAGVQARADVLHVLHCALQQLDQLYVVGGG